MKRHILWESSPVKINSLFPCFVGDCYIWTVRTLREFLHKLFFDSLVSIQINGPGMESWPIQDGDAGDVSGAFTLRVDWVKTIHWYIVCSERSRSLFWNGFEISYLWSTVLCLWKTRMSTVYDKTLCENSSAFTCWTRHVARDAVVPTPLPSLFWTLPRCHGYR